MDNEKRLMETSWRERLTVGETGSCSDGRGNAPLNFNPVFCWWEGCVPSLLFDLRPNYDGGNDDNGDLLQKVLTQCHYPSGGHYPSTPLLEAPGCSQVSLGQSLVGSLLLPPGSWCTQSFVCALQESVSPVLCKFWWLYGGVNGNLLQDGLCHTQVCCTQSPCPCGRTLLACISLGNTQTQVLFSLCGVYCYAQGTVWGLQASLADMGFNSKCDFTQLCLNQWNHEPCHVRPSKMDGSWWRVLTKCGPREKGVTNHFSILALRTL